MILIIEEEIEILTTWDRVRRASHGVNAETGEKVSLPAILIDDLVTLGAIFNPVFQHYTLDAV